VTRNRTARLSIDDRPLLRKRAPRATIEKFNGDCLDVRALHSVGFLQERRVTWSVAKIRADRYLVELVFYQRSIPQQIRVLWTRCHLEHAKPAAFRGLQAATAPWRDSFAHRTIPGTATGHASENIRAAEASRRAIGGTYIDPA
jgi:hypothetical protein